MGYVTAHSEADVPLVSGKINALHQTYQSCKITLFHLTIVERYTRKTLSSYVI
jgi:hypothetical protein